MIYEYERDIEIEMGKEIELGTRMRMRNIVALSQPWGPSGLFETGAPDRHECPKPDDAGAGRPKFYL